MASSTEQALLTHILSQMEANVDFLVQHNYITATDASAIRAKLPNRGRQAVRSAPQPSPTPSTAPSRPAPQSPSAPAVKAKAIWGYNEDGSVSMPRHAPNLSLTTAPRNPKTCPLGPEI
jgi:LAS seventeen-binding protein 1/2